MEIALETWLVHLSMASLIELSIFERRKIAIFRIAALIWWSLWQMTLLTSSLKWTSRVLCDLFSICQWFKLSSSNSSGLALSPAILVIIYVVSSLSCMSFMLQYFRVITAACLIVVIPPKFSPPTSTTSIDLDSILPWALVTSDSKDFIGKFLFLWYWMRWIISLRILFLFCLTLNR